MLIRTRACTAVAAVVPMVALLVTAEGPVSAVVPGPNGKIAFVLKTEGSGDNIVTMDADGSHQVQITTGADGYSSPSWSPDSTKIAFSRHPAGEPQPIFEIGTMNADGTGQNAITSANRDRHPSWSPDGTKIAFVRVVAGVNNEIFTMNADGSNQANVTNDPADDRDPAWSPDGTRIAFTRGARVFTMNSDGGSQIGRTNGNADGDPAWSPDGTKIAFRRDLQLFAMNADGTNPSNVIELRNWIDGDPAWSPGGTRIAFGRSVTGSHQEIYSEGVEPGDDTVRLTVTDGPGAVEPSWGVPTPQCQGKNVTIAGTSGSDVLVGTAGPDVIAGLGANDTIDGKGGADLICGGDGIDTVTYGSQSAAVTANLTGGSGDDGSSLDGSIGSRDSISTDVEQLTGGSGNDVLTGSSVANRLDGGAGNDVLNGMSGADVINGGSGVDTATYAGRAGGVVVAIAGTANDGSSADGPAGARDNVTSTIENLIGGNGGDTLTGSSVANRLTGGPGADQLRGMAGADVLIAKDGVKDVLIDCGTSTDPAPTRDAVDPAPVNCP